MRSKETPHKLCGTISGNRIGSAPHEKSPFGVQEEHCFPLGFTQTCVMAQPMLDSLLNAVLCNSWTRNGISTWLQAQDLLATSSMDLSMRSPWLRLASLSRMLSWERRLMLRARRRFRMRTREGVLECRGTRAGNLSRVGCDMLSLVRPFLGVGVGGGMIGIGRCRRWVSAMTRGTLY